MTEPRLFEATVLPARAVSWAGRLYSSGESLVLPEADADELEIGGFVVIGAPVTAATRRRKPS
jgi:hypothetical protein